ncbi:MAG: tetratricopeptide repeat-containing sulfotransferase family protein, partial [Phycisphaerales bacterium JB041]
MPLPPQQKLQRVQAALRMEAANDHEGAIRVYRELIGQDPDDARLHFHLALALHATLEFEGALRAAQAAVRLNGAIPEFYAIQALAYRGLNRLDDARASAELGLALNAGNIACAKLLGDICFLRGDLDEGLARLSPLVAGGVDHPQVLVVYAQLLSARGRPEEARDILQRAVAKPGIQPQAAAPVHLHLGSVCEKLNDNETAWSHYTTGNRLRNTVFHPGEHDAAVTDIMTVWSKDRLAKLPRAKGKKSEQLVFIVGMPRSGTSLVEQIIASHPDVYGGGELNVVIGVARELLLPTAEHPNTLARADALTQAAVDRASHRAQELMTAPAPQAKRFTDKLPQNFLHLGLIQTLFPHARVIQCIRDPRDVCLSCFTKYFGGANSQPFSGDLTHLGRYFRAHERLMAHWHRTLDLPIFEAYYEQGVQDIDTYARALIDFIGLE